MATSGDLLVSIDEAVLQINNPAEEELTVLMYLQMAQGIVIDRLERATSDSDLLNTIASWTAETLPGGVKSAVLHQLCELYRYRGDDEYEIKTSAPGRLSNHVERTLGPWLDLPLA